MAGLDIAGFTGLIPVPSLVVDVLTVFGGLTAVAGRDVLGDAAAKPLLDPLVRGTPSFY